MRARCGACLASDSGFGRTRGAPLPRSVEETGNGGQSVHGVRLDLWAFVALETEGLAILSGRCGLSIQQPPLKQHLQGRRHRGRRGPEAGEPSLFIVGQRSTKNRKECHYERALQESEAKPWTRSGSGYGYLCRCWGAQCRRGAAGLAAKVICSYNLNYG